MNHPLQAALIGVGGFGRSHFRHLIDLQSQGRIQLRAVADPTIDRLPEIRAQLQDAHIPCYPSDQEMQEKEADLDFVTISSPIPLHEEMVRRWLKSRAWIYLEKPPVPTIQQLREIIALDTDQRVRVGFQQVHHPAIRQLKAWILEGRFGKLRRISAVAGWPRTDAYYQRSPWAAKLLIHGKACFDGPATNALAHPIQNLMFLAGDQSESFGIPSSMNGEFYRARDIESYDAVTLSGQFPSGVTFDIGFAHCVETPLASQLRVEGSRATAVLNQENFSLTCSDENKAQSFKPETIPPMYDAFLNQVAQTSPPAASTLQDCLGYSLVTCGGLLSSGEIFPIPASAKHGYGIDEAAGIHVPELNEALKKFGETGESFVDQGISWAKKGRVIDTASITSLDLSTYL